jgi:hypothetical protein
MSATVVATSSAPVAPPPQIGEADAVDESDIGQRERGQEAGRRRAGQRPQRRFDRGRLRRLQSRLAGEAGLHGLRVRDERAQCQSEAENVRDTCRGGHVHRQLE